VRLSQGALTDVPVQGGTRDSQGLGDWDAGAIELGWVVIEEGNTFRLRKLTNHGPVRPLT
jgi:hypothetical protein